MTDLYLKEGDTAKAIEFVVDDPTIIFTGASVVLNMINSQGVHVISNAACTILTETVGGTEYTVFRYTPTAQEISTPGSYRLEWKVTFANSDVGRFPGKGYVTAMVGSNIDAPV